MTEERLNKVSAKKIILITLLVIFSIFAGTTLFFLLAKYIKFLYEVLGL